MRRIIDPVTAFATKLTRITRLNKLPKLTRKQWIKLAAGVVVVYLVVLGVNVLVLINQIDGNDSRIGGTRSTVDALSLNFNLASRILDADLKDQQAIGRVGGYYLTEERFSQLVITEKKIRQSRKLPVAESNAKFLTDKILDRMLTEQLVGEYAREHNLSADPADVERRITANLVAAGSLEKLESALQATRGWTLPDFRYEIEYSILRSKMEEALGGIKFDEAVKGSLENAKTVKVNEYADSFARSHTNYLVSGGINTLAKRLLAL